MKYNIYINKIIKLISIILIFLFLILTCNICFANTNNNNLTLHCNSNLLMDAESGNVLFEKNGYSKIYPASTTKILTAILVLDNLSLDEKVIVSQNVVNSIPIGSSVMGVKSGELFSVENLLYGLLLPSGNDAALVLAEAVSGNVDDFVTLMNQKSKEIGCLNTHFTNPHGFFDENHYTTAYDMALILKYAMNYDEFRKISETKTWELPVSNKTDHTKILKNTNRLLDENYSVFYEYALGGKTGYTIESRGTYIGYAKKYDKLIITACFDGSQNINGQNGRFLDAITLSNFCFDNFNKEKIVSKDTFKFIITDENTCQKYQVSLKDDIYSLTKNNDYITLTPTLDITSNDNNLTSKIHLKVNGNNILIDNVYDAQITNLSTYISYNNILRFIPYILFILLFIILILLIWKIKKSKKYELNF